MAEPPIPHGGAAAPHSRRNCLPCPSAAPRRRPTAGLPHLKFFAGSASDPEYVAKFDRLTPEDIVWEPYSPLAIAARAPLRISSVCTQDQVLWMTTAVLVYDVAVPG